MKCGVCGLEVGTRRKVCAACKELASRAAVKISENRRDFTKLDGSSSERKVFRTSTSSILLVEHHGPWERLTSESSFGQLIEIALAVCFSSPPYLRTDECRRHIAFLEHLSCSTAEAWDYGEMKKVPMMDLSLKQISRPIEEWVFSFFSEEQPALFPHYALHTATFMEYLLMGHYHWRPDWKLRSLLVDSDINKLHRLPFFDSSSKRRFTELINCEVLAQVPEHVTVQYGDQNIPIGPEFLFSVRRCHLSQVVGDFSFCKVTGCESKEDFSLDELALNGNILISRGDFYDVQLRFDLPISWITHEVVRRGHNQRSLTPIRRW